MEKQQNLDGPVEIGQKTYWIGSAAKELLKRNVYLRVFNDNGKTINLLIDPGPPTDFETVSYIGKVMSRVPRKRFVLSCLFTCKNCYATLLFY